MAIQFLLKFRHIVFSSIFAFTLGCTITLMLLRIDSCSVNNFETGMLKIAKPEHHDVKKEYYYLLVLIISSPSNTVLRNAIRSSWFNYCKQTKEVYCKFILGSAGLSVDENKILQSELNEHDDILLLDNVYDAYVNLTSKVLEAFVWASQKMEYKFLLKCDDDSFIRIPQIVDELHSLNEDTAHNLFWGFFDGRARVKKKGKWQESHWILCDFYLPYALGGGYVLSNRLVKYIEHNAPYLQKFSSEDVSVGVWLANLAGIKHKHEPRFDTEYRSRGCHNSYMITHKCGPLEFSQFWRQLQKDKSTLCPGGREFRTRLSYQYNWTLPPSQCCVRFDNTVP